MANYEDVFKKVVAHAKEYGFVFQSSEIYDGLSAVYDYGPNGVELKNNIKNYWWKSMVNMHENIVGLDAAIFMHPTTWKASGHVDAFNDPLIDNKDSKKRYRADLLIEDHIAKIEAKIEKDVVKAAKRFGDVFSREEFVSTNDRILDRQYDGQIELDRAIILTDDHAPVENFLNPLTRRTYVKEIILANKTVITSPQDVKMNIEPLRLDRGSIIAIVGISVIGLVVLASYNYASSKTRL